MARENCILVDEAEGEGGKSVAGLELNWCQMQERHRKDPADWLGQLPHHQTRPFVVHLISSHLMPPPKFSSFLFCFFVFSFSFPNFFRPEVKLLLSRLSLDIPR